VRELNEKRLRAWEAAKALLDEVNVRQGRDLTAAETAQFDRMMDDITRLDRERDDLTSSDEAQRTVETLNEEARRAARPDDDFEQGDQRGRDVLRDFFRPHHAPGRYNAINIDLRKAANAVEAIRQGARGEEFRLIAGDTGASGGSLTIPTGVAPSIYAYMTASVAMRRMNTTIITTDHGNPVLYPRVSAHGIGTQVINSNTAFSGTDAVLSTMTLNAWDYGELVAVSNDILEDTGTDILEFIAKNVARAVGQYSATQYVTGTGSSQAQGVMTAGCVGAAGTVATGGSLIIGPVGAELEKLIDVQYSIADSYRLDGKASWLMRDATGARVRKIRDGAGGTAGQFVWVPSPTVGAIGGQPDTFLGSPVFFDPNVASMASDAKILAYGDFSAYYIRDVIGFRLERSDDLYFDKNQAAFRGLLRSDGDVIDTQAINILHQAVA
jgi:HK97 family phage major capsid protein